MSTESSQNIITLLWDLNNKNLRNSGKEVILGILNKIVEEMHKVGVDDFASLDLGGDHLTKFKLLPFLIDQPQDIEKLESIGDQLKTEFFSKINNESEKKRKEAELKGVKIWVNSGHIFYFIEQGKFEIADKLIRLKGANLTSSLYYGNYGFDLLLEELGNLPFSIHNIDIGELFILAKKYPQIAAEMIKRGAEYDGLVHPDSDYSNNGGITGTLSEPIKFVNAALAEDMQEVCLAIFERNPNMSIEHLAHREDGSSSVKSISLINHLLAENKLELAVKLVQAPSFSMSSYNNPGYYDGDVTRLPKYAIDNNLTELVVAIFNRISLLAPSNFEGMNWITYMKHKNKDDVIDNIVFSPSFRCNGSELHQLFNKIPVYMRDDLIAKIISSPHFTCSAFELIRLANALQPCLIDNIISSPHFTCDVSTLISIYDKFPKLAKKIASLGKVDFYQMRSLEIFGTLTETSPTLAAEIIKNSKEYAPLHLTYALSKNITEIVNAILEKGDEIISSPNVTYCASDLLSIYKKFPKLAEKIASLGKVSFETYDDYGTFCTLANTSPTLAAEIIRNSKISNPARLLINAIDNSIYENEIIDLILEIKDFDPNLKISNGSNLPLYALKHNRNDIAEKLISLKSFDLKKCTIEQICIIAKLNQEKVVEFIKAGGNYLAHDVVNRYTWGRPEPKQVDKYQLIIDAIENNFTEILDAIFEREDFNPNMEVGLYSKKSLAIFCSATRKMDLVLKIVLHPKFNLKDSLDVLDSLQQHMNENEYSKFLVSAPEIAHKILIAKLHAGKTDFVKNVVTHTKASGEFSYNVNKLDADGKRLIDHAAELVKARKLPLSFIKTLRECGSVEPAIPLKISESETEMLNLRNEELDSKSNAQKIIPLIDKMYQKYPLTEAATNRIISDYKQNNSEAVEVAYGYNACSIADVIDRISGDAYTQGDMGTRMQDRISKPINCKKMIATVIHIVETNATKMVACPADPSIVLPLADLFKATLRELKMCNLGKLINIVATVQQFVISEIDYSIKDFDTAFKPAFDLALNIVKNKLGDGAKKAVAIWMYDISSSTNPEDWSPLTQSVNAIINKEFVNYGVVNLESSYHFNGVMTYAIKRFAEKLNPQINKDSSNNFGEWSKHVKLGVKHMAKDFCAKAVQMLNAGEPVDALFNNVVMNLSTAYGNFENVPTGIFTDAMDNLHEDKKAKFIALVIEKLTTSPQTCNTLTALLVAETYTNPKGVAEALESCNIMNLITEKHQNTLKLFMDKYYQELEAATQVAEDLLVTPDANSHHEYILPTGSIFDELD